MQLYFIILSIVLNTFLFVSAGPVYRYSLEVDSQSNVPPMSNGTPSASDAPGTAGTPDASGAPGASGKAAPADDKPDKKPQDAQPDIFNEALSKGRVVGGTLLENAGNLVTGG